MDQKKQVCRVPSTIEFEFYPEQEMHSFIEIENLINEIVSFKIKTNAPTQYLVKPMEGQIYKRQKMKIVFKRKKISQEDFEAFSNATKPLKEKFMFNITCRSKNAIGIEKTDEQIYYMNVKFCNPRKSQLQPSPAKKVKKSKTSEQKRQQIEMMNTINLEKTKLKVLKQQRIYEQSKMQQLQCARSQPNRDSLPSSQLTLGNIICLILIFFFVGLWI